MKYIVAIRVAEEVDYTQANSPLKAFIQDSLMYLVVKTESGKVERVPAREGASVMELIRGAGFDELLALCGGCCSCATCHVYVEEPGLARLTPIEEDESALLDVSSYRTANSRLSCQIPFTAALSGLIVTIAPEE